jgi:maltooligosyltrehalose trehalohydrolase
MGEEWGASTPWRFFTSHPEPELAEAVRTGRIEEFAAMDWDTENVSDPQDPDTFLASKLDWDEIAEPRHGDLLALVTRLLELRRSYPAFTDPRFDAGRARSDDEEGWLVLERDNMAIVVNFSQTPAVVTLDDDVSSVLEVGTVAVDGATVRLEGTSALVGRLALARVP